MLANILCQHTPLTPGVWSKDIFFSFLKLHTGKAQQEYNRGTVINIYILQPPFWVSLIFFFSLECSGFSKVSMISVLGKIKEMCLVLCLSKKCVRVG